MIIPPKPTRPLVQKLFLALFLMFLAILLVWRLANAPDDATKNGSAKTGAHPERGESQENSNKGHNTRYGSESRGAILNKLRNYVENVSAPKIAAEALDGYLAENQRSAQSLLAAFSITPDIALLHEAVERFPDDPSVQLQRVMQGISSGGSSEEIHKALDGLRAAAPENALPDWLSALQHLKENDLESALKDLSAAAGKSAFDDYLLSSIQGREDAYLAAGLPLAEAKWLACMGVSASHLAELRRGSGRLSDLQKSYSQSGDAEAAESVRQAGLQLGKSLQGGISSFGTLSGFVIEKRFLDPVTSAGRIAEIDQHRGEANELVRLMKPRLSGISDKEIILYTERIKQEGDMTAMKWLLNR